MKISTIALLSTLLPALPVLAQEQATYEFEFIAEWGAVTHPQSFPNNPHFSPLTGATHNDQISLWSPGTLATNGIEAMAETGGTNALQGEVNTHISNGNADQFIRRGPIGLSPGSTDGVIEAHRDFPLLTLVTMIAPSPDWFVGIHDLNLRQDGVWIDEVIIDLAPYDSGTDSGVNYTSPNSNTNPADPIANIADQFPFTGTPRIGTLRITRTSDAACSVADLALPYEDLDFLDISAFIGAFNGNQPAADLNGDDNYDFLDISAFINAYTTGCP